MMISIFLAQIRIHWSRSRSLIQRKRKRKTNGLSNNKTMTLRRESKAREETLDAGGFQPSPGRLSSQAAFEKYDEERELIVWSKVKGF